MARDPERIRKGAPSKVQVGNGCVPKARWYHGQRQSPGASDVCAAVPGVRPRGSFVHWALRTPSRKVHSRREGERARRLDALDATSCVKQALDATSCVKQETQVSPPARISPVQGSAVTGIEKIGKESAGMKSRPSERRESAAGKKHQRRQRSGGHCPARHGARVGTATPWRPGRSEVRASLTADAAERTHLAAPEHVKAELPTATGPGHTAGEAQTPIHTKTS